jgi:hypothetical protein|tara:strand:- start:3865 stop:4401 length:537 start_codon:yes stop_codon:yes gene_type:complete
MRIIHLGFASLIMAVCAVCFATALQPNMKTGRLIEDWPYAKLFETAETVVIARPVSNNDSDARSNDNLWKIEFRGVDTAFEVSSILKGKANAKIIVSHFKLPPDAMVEDGPLHSSFRTKPLNLEMRHVKMVLPVPEYMLFLKLNANGNYELITGYTDPSLAVREMYTGTSGLGDANGG